MTDRADDPPAEPPERSGHSGAPGTPAPRDQPGGGLNPPLSDRDIEHRFADIVAQWHRDGLPDARAHPEALDQQDPDETRDEAADPKEAAPTTDPATAVPIRPPMPEATPWRVHTPPPDPDDEDYVPPPPRPLPTSGDLGFWAALFGLVAGPLWLIYIAVADPGGSRLAVGLALALTVGGFAIVVARLPRGRRDDADDDDDGAVV